MDNKDTKLGMRGGTQVCEAERVSLTQPIAVGNCRGGERKRGRNVYLGEAEVTVMVARMALPNCHPNVRLGSVTYY